MAASGEPARKHGYGHWNQPKTPGIFGFDRAASFALFGGAIVGVLVMAVAGVGPAFVVFLAVLGVVVAATRQDKHGRTMVKRLATRAAFGRARLERTNLYRAGLLGFTPYGKTQLPGLAAQTELTEWSDSWGRPFGLIRVPSSEHFTIVFRGEPHGGSLVDQEQLDQWVAEWGQWLASLGNEPGIVAASVTIETAPDSGARLRREVAATGDPGAPALAKAVLAQIVEDYPRGSASLQALVAVTFAGEKGKGRQSVSVEEVSRDIGARIGTLSQSLARTGAGVTAPLSAQQLIEFVRVAFDPESADVFADAHMAGSDLGLTWDQAGPVAAEAAWDFYRHDSGVSKTWQMSRAPRGIVQDTVLRRLLEPHPLITRKRVTLLYRPYDLGESATIVERDKNNAEARVNSTTKPTMAARLESVDAQVSAEAEAMGAGLVNFGLLVTATVLSADELPDVSRAINSLATGSRILLRPMNGTQDLGFVANLPLGLVLPEYQQLTASKGVQQ